mmetsp:Transcript_33878/g.57870  ORF Transcript_33878/g.57870 Transcript_33878/m.57870 type:complete len:140 (+) Transcript_33878:54-473(+)
MGEGGINLEKEPPSGMPSNTEELQRSLDYHATNLTTPSRAGAIAWLFFCGFFLFLAVLMFIGWFVVPAVLWTIAIIFIFTIVLIPVAIILIFVAIIVMIVCFCLFWVCLLLAFICLIFALIFWLISMTQNNQQPVQEGA